MNCYLRCEITWWDFLSLLTCRYAKEIEKFNIKRRRKCIAKCQWIERTTITTEFEPNIEDCYSLSINFRLFTPSKEKSKSQQNVPVCDRERPTNTHRWQDDRSDKEKNEKENKFSCRSFVELYICTRVTGEYWLKFEVIKRRRWTKKVFFLYFCSIYHKNDEGNH